MRIDVRSIRLLKCWSRLIGLATNPIVHGSALLSIAEIGNRLSRIVTAVVLARYLSPLQFGTISLVLAIFELGRMFIHNGIGARIVQATEAELGAVCTGATRVNWAVGMGMCALQSALAYPLQWTFAQPIATMLIAGRGSLVRGFALSAGSAKPWRKRRGLMTNGPMIERPCEAIAC